MDLTQFLNDYSISVLISLVCLALTAGFIDAVVGGGGLIQLPALLIGLPQTPIASIFGTNKLAAFSGTTVAAIQYAKKIRFNIILLSVLAICAYLSSMTGAKLINHLDTSLLKPVILIILILIAIYVFTKKDLGSLPTKNLALKKQIILGALIAIVVGFYDGFFGPGAGSFLILGFVMLLGFDFVTASAYAKIINCFTNISALIVFVRLGNYLLEIGILMAVFNILGNIIGSRMALKNGNGFVRKIFLVVVTLMIIRYGYDIFYTS